MKATELLQQWPPGGPSAEREAAVLDAIRNHMLQPDWREVRTESRGHRGIIYVAADTLQVGEPGDSIRVMVSARMWQTIADEMGWTMPTVKVSDLINAQATVRIEPVLTAGDARMADYRAPDGGEGRMVEVSREIDKRIGGRAGLASSFHKDWVLTKRLTAVAGSAANYGYFSHRAPYETHSGERAWQTLGTRHASSHLDNSQQLRPILNRMLIDGVERSFAAILTGEADTAHDSEYAELISDEGKLPWARMPGVAIANRQAILDSSI